MQVANIIEESRIAGPQIRNLLVASTLKKKDIEVTLIFPAKNSRDLIKRCNLSNQKFLSLDLCSIKGDIYGFLKYLFFFPFEVLELAKILKKKKYDLVHVSGGCLHTKGVIAAKLAGLKVIWELNDTHVPKILKTIFSFISFLADSFIFASERTKKYYLDAVPVRRKKYVIQSPVNTDFLNPDLKIKSDSFLKKKSFEKKIIIGTVGNVNPNKGHETFIKMASKISQYNKKIVFIVVGPIYESQKKYFNYLSNLIKLKKIRNIYFIGAKKDIRPILNKIDIYVCSSNNESSPLAVWEAMAMKKPIISTNVGDVNRYIKNNINGFLIKVGDVDDLLEKILKLVKNPKLRRKFGNISRKIVKKKLNIDLCSRLHKKTYLDTILEIK